MLYLYLSLLYGMGFSLTLGLSLSLASEVANIKSDLIAAFFWPAVLPFLIGIRLGR